MQIFLIKAEVKDTMMVLNFRLIKGEYIWKIFYKLTSSLLKQVALNISFGI